MKTYAKDYAIDSNELISFNEELERVISTRQEKFYDTMTYSKASVNEIVDELGLLLPKGKINKLKDAVVHLECVLYSAAYKDGMTDLMTTMTLNNLGITKAEYIDLGVNT